MPVPLLPGREEQGTPAAVTGQVLPVHSMGREAQFQSSLVHIVCVPAYIKVS